MNEQAIIDAHNIFASRGYGGTKEDFIKLISKDQNAFNDSFTLFKDAGYKGSSEGYMALLGVGGSGEKPEEEEEDEVVLTHKETLAATVVAKNQSFWDANQDLGSFEGYTQNEDGNWMDASGKVVLYRQSVTDPTTGRFRPGIFQSGRVITDNAGGANSRTYTWESSLMGGDKAKALALQLKDQSGDIASDKNILAGAQVLENNPDLKDAVDVVRQAAKFDANNSEGSTTTIDVDGKDVEVELPPINKNEWEFEMKYDVSTWQGQLLQVRQITNINTGEVITEDALPNVPGQKGIADKRYLELIDILGKEAKVETRKVENAKSEGARKVDEIKASDLNTKENWALDNLNNTNLYKMGFTVTDEGFELGYGDLTIKDRNGEKFQYEGHGITTGGGASAGEIKALNKWLKEHAYHHDTSLDASVLATSVTADQAKENNEQAAKETADMAAIQRLKTTEDRDQEDKLFDKILSDAAKMFGLSVSDGALKGSKVKQLQAYKWIQNNLNTQNYIDDKGRTLGELGFTIHTIRGPKVKPLTEGQKRLDMIEVFDPSGKSPTGTKLVPNPNSLTDEERSIASQYLYKGYETTENFLERNSEDARTFNAAVDREAKRQFVKNINDALGKENQLSDADENAIMSASANEIEGFRNLPESVVDAIDTSGVSFSEIRRGINTINENVIGEVERALVQPKNAEDVKQNIYKNIESRSGNWWSDEEFKNKLEEDAADRWEELKSEDKRLVAATQELRGQFDNNSKLLDEALAELDELKFDGLTAKEALDKISKGKYTTQEEVNDANARAQEISSAYRAVAGRVNAHVAANKVYIDLTIDLRKEMKDLNLDIEDLSWYKDVISDRTALGFQVADAFLNGVVELGQGFIELGGLVADVQMAIVGATWGALGTPFGLEFDEGYSAIDDWYSTTAFGDRRVQHAIDSWQDEGAMGSIFGGGKSQQAVSLDNAETAGDYAEWALTTLGSQAPQLILMYATGGIGSAMTKGMQITTKAALKYQRAYSLGTMGSTAMGTKYKNLREENELYKSTNGLYGNNYSLAQMLLVSAGTGLAEAGSELITFNLMKGIPNAFSREARILMQKQMKDGGVKYLQKQFLSGQGIKRSFGSLGMTGMEGLSEGVATMSENFLDANFLGKDVHIFDNVKESVVTGLMIGGMMSTPALYARAISPFTSFNAKQEYAAAYYQEVAGKKALDKAIADGVAPEIIEELQESLIKIKADLIGLKELTLKRVDEFSTKEVETLINIDSQQIGIENKINRVRNDKNLSTEARNKILERLVGQHKAHSTNKSKIIDQYDVNMVDRGYERKMRRITAMAEEGSKDGGVPQNVQELGVNDYVAFLEKHNTPEEFKAAVEQLEAIANDETKTEGERKTAKIQAVQIQNYTKLQASEGASGSYGANVPIIKNGKLIGFEIVINKNKAKLEGMSSTIVHEFEHSILYNTIQQDRGIQSAIGNEVSNLIESGDVKFKNKDGAKVYWNRVAAYEAEGRGEEQLVVMTEMLNQGLIKWDDGIVKKFKRWIRHIQMRAGRREIKFDNVEDLKDFVNTYARTVNTRWYSKGVTIKGKTYGKFTNKALEKMQREGAEGEIITRGKNMLFPELRKNEIRTLEKLRDEGSITEEQFKEKKEAFTVGRAQKAREQWLKNKGETAFSNSMNSYIDANPEQYSKNKKRFDDLTQNEDGNKKWDDKEEWINSAEKWEAFSLIDDSNTFMDNLIMSGVSEGEGYIRSEQAKRDFIKQVKEGIQDRLIGGLKKTYINKIEAIKESRMVGDITAKEAAEQVANIENNPSNYRVGFDPTMANGSLFGWIIGGSGKANESRMYRAIGDVFKAYKKDPSKFSVSLDAKMGDSGVTFADMLEGESDVTGDDVLRKELEEISENTKIQDDIGLNEISQEKVQDVVETSGIDVKQFKDTGYKGTKEEVLGVEKVRNKNNKLKNPTKTSEVKFTGKLSGVLKVMSNEFGVSAKKVPSRLALTNTERDNIRDYISTHAVALHNHRPEQHSSKGKSTGVPPKYLEAHYDRVIDPETGEQVRGGTDAATALGFLGMDAQGTDLWTVKEQTVPEFAEQFGIEGTMEDGKFVETGRSINTDKSFDGILHGQVAVTSTGVGNEALREQSLESNPSALEIIAIMGDGKGMASFSLESVSKMGRFNGELSALEIFVFREKAPELGDNLYNSIIRVEEGGAERFDKQGEERMRKLIRSAILDTYGGIFTTTQRKLLEDAIYSIALSNRIPLTDRGKVTRRDALKRELETLNMDEDFKVVSYSGVTRTREEIFGPPVEINGVIVNIIDDMQGYTMELLSEEEVDAMAMHKDNPMAAGIELMMRMGLLQQQVATAGTVKGGYKNTGGKRAQFYQNSKLFWDAAKKKTGLDFSYKKSVDKNGKVTWNIDYSKPITFTPPGSSTSQKLQPEYVKLALGNDSQSGAAVIQEMWLDEITGSENILGRELRVKAAREHASRYAAFHARLHNSDPGVGHTNEHQAAAMWNQLSNMKPTLARGAMPKYIGEDMLPKDWRDKKKWNKKKIRAWIKKNLKGDLEPVFEHMQPRVVATIDLHDAHLFRGGIKNVDSHFENYDVQIISKRMDVDGLKAAGLNNALSKGQTLEDPSWLRNYNSKTAETGVMVGLIGIGQNSDVNADQAFIKANEITRKKLDAMRQNAIANGMLMNSKAAAKGSKGISILDFDDTLATTKSEVIVIAPDGTQTKINAEEFAKQGSDLLAEGNTFDFSEFNKVVKGKTAPLFNKALKLAGKFSTKDMFILTARNAAAAPAIKQFLDANDLNIPIENIVGLGKSEASAKAEWVAGKIGEGYNDFYFADDAIQNVDAVKEMLNQYDVKGKVQQAKLQFSLEAPKRMSNIIDESIQSRDLDSDLNTILEESRGIKKEKRFSPAKARQRGKKKGKWKFFVPPSADDFAGLMYYFLGKGKKGEEHHAWFKKNLFDPFSKGVRHLNMIKQAVAYDMKMLRNAMPEVKRLLTKNVKGTEYTHQDAIRVYNWDRAGFDIPGLSETDKNKLIAKVKNDPKLKAFADSVGNISSQTANGVAQPGEHWLAGTIASDLNDALENARKTYLAEWIENKNIIFNSENLNKIEAVYGSNFREALEDSLFRMEHGGNRSRGAGRLLNNFTNWIHGSIGTTMFFNARSAVLQMISNVNFVNWSDNNMLKAAAAFANQPQYWKDVSMIFNSPFLKQRRAGLQTDVNAAELLAQIQGSKNKMKAATAYLLKLGFTPTQIADSLAIATGGATFYRNRTNTYISEGMSKADAETKAFEDMMELAEETQQSAREDKISQQQASPLGKFILAFQNTPMQYNRLIKKAAMDLVNGRGDPKANVSRIVYYGAIQNMIFYGLQQALFAALFSDDEEDEISEKQKEKVINGMMDTILRGSGIAGAVVATAKNVIIKTARESEKMDDDNFFTDPDWGNVVIEALNLSPPIGIKARKIYSSLKTWEYNKDVINHMDKTDIDNPMYDGMFSAIEAVTNLPLSRLYSKYQNIQEAMSSDHETWKRVAMVLGWSKWNFGIKNQDVMTAKQEVKEIKAEEKEVKAAEKKAQKEAEQQAANESVIQGHVEEQEQQREDGVSEDEITCAAVKRNGGRCSKTVLSGQTYCTIHEEVDQRADGEKKQCSHIKDNGDRCKMKTKNKSGKCYYHD